MFLLNIIEIFQLHSRTLLFSSNIIAIWKMTNESKWKPEKVYPFLLNNLPVSICRPSIQSQGIYLCWTKLADSPISFLQEIYWNWKDSAEIPYEYLAMLERLLPCVYQRIFRLGIAAILGNQRVQQYFGWTNIPELTKNYLTVERQISTEIEKYLNPTKITTTKLRSKHKQIQKICQQVTHDVMSSKTYRKAWEQKFPEIVNAIVEFIHSKGARILPSLADDRLFIESIRIEDIHQHLEELKKIGIFTFIPEMEALRRSLTNKTSKLARNAISIQLCPAKKISVHEHPHKGVLLKHAQLLRDIIFYGENRQSNYQPGLVLFCCSDDLSQIPTDSLIKGLGCFRGLWTKVGTVPHAPCYDFPNGHRLVFSSNLFLTPHNNNNKLRIKGTLHNLQRFGSWESLPIWERQYITKEEYEKSLSENKQQGKGYSLQATDRSGIGIVMIRPYCKEKIGTQMKHLPWSRPSTPIQHSIDRMQIYDEMLKSNHSLFGQNNQIAPYLIYASDNGTDQTVYRLESVMALYYEMKLLNLDGVEKSGFPPKNSKYNPAELVNMTVRSVISGKVLSSGNGSQEAMKELMESVRNILKGKIS